MLKIFIRLFFFSFLLFLIARFSPLFGCGAAPPASIPAPVASFAAPGAPGTATISGTAPPGSTVAAANLTAGGTTQLRQSFFIKNAYAQAFCTGVCREATADPMTGDFTITGLQANPGEDIGLRAHNGGAESCQLTIPFPCGTGGGNPPTTAACPTGPLTLCP